MGLLGDILGFAEYTPIGWISNAVNAGLDSLGLSQHGRDQAYQNEQYWSSLEAQQAFQREMQANSQDFTKKMYSTQLNDMLYKYPALAQRLNDQQFNMWRQQFNMQNAWNEEMYQKYQSPQAVASMNAAAGLNPAGLNGVNNGVSANTMGASSAQTPPQISPTPFGTNGSPVGVPQGISGKGSDLAEVGQFLKDYSQMQLNQKMAGRYDEKMDADIKSALASAGLAEQQSKYQELVNSVDAFFLSHKKSSEVKLNLALAAKAAAEGDEAKAQERLDNALTELNNTKNEEAKARLPFVELELRAGIDEIKASAQEKRAQAAEANQRTQTERYNTQIKSIQAELDGKTKLSKLATLLNELHSKRHIDSAKYKDAKIRLDRLRVIEKQHTINASK